MAVICIIIITLGTALSLINLIVALKLSFFSALKNPFFYSQLLSLIGLSGLIFYGTDFFDANRHQLSFTIESGLPSLLESLSKVLWPTLGFVLLFWFANQVLFLLKNPGIYQPLAQTIFGGKAQPSTTQSTISSSPKNFGSDYQKEEYEKLQAEYNSLSENDRVEKLLDFAVLRKIMADFEFLFNIIYGTQISALKALANNVSLDVHSFYDEYLVKQKSLLPKDKPLTYDQWEKFFLDNFLASKDGNFLKISSKGKDFVKLVSQRYEKAL